MQGNLGRHARRRHRAERSNLPLGDPGDEADALPDRHGAPRALAMTKQHRFGARFHAPAGASGGSSQPEVETIPARSGAWEALPDT